MAYENNQTYREEWNEISNLTQVNINETLEDCALDIEAANLSLASLHDSDPEAAVTLAEDITEHLNDQWGYSGDYFHISGQWLEPSVSLSNDGILVRYNRANAFDTVQSNGFMVKMIEGEAGNSKPVLGMSFIVADVPLHTPSIKGVLSVLAFAELSDISLQYLRPGDDSVVSSELGEVSETVYRVDSLLKLYTNHQNSVFFSQSAKNQEKFLRSLIEQVDAVLPAPSSFDKVILKGIETKILKTKSRKDNKLRVLQSEGNDKFNITGSLVGVTMADIAEHGFGTHYTSPADTLMTKEGLSLIIQPHYTNFNLPDDYNTDLLVPLSEIDNFNMTLV